MPRSERKISASDQPQRQPDSYSEVYWPAPFWLTGRIAFGVIAGIVGVFWLLFIVHDLLRAFGPVDEPMWWLLFADNRPIEWLQWFVLIIAVVLAGFLAGKLTGGPARFFLFMAFSLAVIFLEDASDLRHMLYWEYARAALGTEFSGVSTRVISDTIYSALVLVLPAFTLIRYGRHIWHAGGPRNFMLAGFGLYALVAVLSALRHVDDFYHQFGETIDAWLMFGRWPSTIDVPYELTYFYVVDAFLIENLEIFGAACFLSMVLAYALQRRRSPEKESPPGLDDAPGLLNINGKVAFLTIGSLVALAWLLVLIFDLIQVIGPLERPIWEQVFNNNRPAEWVQWATLLTGAILSANLAARLQESQARFFFLMAFALALIFFEDASDLRHVFFYEYWTPHAGTEIAGIPTRVVSDSIYFGVIALVPLYALFRYGWSIWPVHSTRFFLISGFVLYALAGGLSAIRHLNDLYINVGAWIDANIFFSRWPTPEHIPTHRGHFYVMDSFMEETFEALGAACLLAMVLAYAAYWSQTRDESITQPHDPPQLDPRIEELRDNAPPNTRRYRIPHLDGNS